LLSYYSKNFASKIGAAQHSNLFHAHTLVALKTANALVMLHGSVNCSSTKTSGVSYNAVDIVTENFESQNVQ